MMVMVMVSTHSIDLAGLAPLIGNVQSQQPGLSPQLFE